MGASNPHPHGQIWAGTALPVRAAREHAEPGAPITPPTGVGMLLDYVGQEVGGPRVVVEDDEWLVVVPFWAAWPFETLVVPKRPAARLPDLDRPARDALAPRPARPAAALRRACSDGRSRTRWAGTRRRSAARIAAGWQLHAHFYPPLLRASVRKFMVGYELLAETAARPDAGGCRRPAARRVPAATGRPPGAGLRRHPPDLGPVGAGSMGRTRQTEAACGSGAGGSARPTTRGSADFTRSIDDRSRARGRRHRRLDRPRPRPGPRRPADRRRGRRRWSRGLTGLGEDVAAGPIDWDPALEDVHLNLESALTERIGPVAGKLHTGRSRNDQVATDLRLWTRRAIDRLDAALLDFERALVDLAEREGTPCCPARPTSSPPSRCSSPITCSPTSRWPSATAAGWPTPAAGLNVSPLGAGALAGAGYPLDREATAARARLRRRHRQLARRRQRPRLRGRGARPPPRSAWST